MRVTITTGGSRGDLQPYVALAVGLRQHGVDVRIATSSEFEGFVREQGLDFHPVALDVQQIIGDLLEKGGGVMGLGRGLAEQFGPLMEQNLEDYWSASEDADAIVWGPSGFLGCYIAQARGIPAAAAEMQPIVRPTGRYRSAVTPALPSFVGDGRAAEIANRLSYVLVHEVFWQSFRPYINRTLTEGLGLEPMIALEPSRRATDSAELALCGWSPSVLPRPSDYGDHMHVTGYWFLDAGKTWEPPADLMDFLDSGSPPVSVGFGSMNRVDPERMVEVVSSALRRSGNRGILLTGWSGMERADLPDDVFAIEGAPHDWLFPRVAAAVHHGGSGTTGASLRAGVPTVTVPFFFDQQFWGETVATLGAGPPPVSRGRTLDERLATAISRATSDASIKRNARQVGSKIATEDGVGNAIRALEAHGVVR